MEDSKNDILAAAAREYIAEQRRSRRSRTFFRIIYVVLFIILIFSIRQAPHPLIKDTSMYGTSGNPDADHVAVIKIIGPILEAGGDASAEKINGLLEEAFSSKKAKAVVLELNTPGGSPVQSDRIAETIVRLRDQHKDKPVYAVVSDVCASGGMYIASVADAVYANRASIVGSIGVVFSSFGFTELIDKIGVERRLMTAGEHKGMLDPFMPLRERDKAYAQAVLDEIHQQFIRRVQAGRGDKLSPNPDLFSGLYWTGEQAKKIGLVDGFGDSRYVIKELVKLDNAVEYQHRETLLEKISTRLAGDLYARLQSFLYHPIGLR